MTATWTWDTAAHGIGQLATAATDNGYLRTHTYDGIGRPSGTTIAIWDSSYSYATSYDATTGQVGTVHYPSGFTALYTYTARGYLNQIKDNASGTVLFTAQARDADLHLTQSLAGNGVTTTNTYWDQTGLLRYVRAGTSDNIANFNYRYDSLGNVTYRADGYANVFERFCYDSLNRLTLAALSHPGDPGTSCTAPGGTVKTVVYDAIGNILSKTGVGAYSYNAGMRPHAIELDRGHGQRRDESALHLRSQWQHDGRGRAQRQLLGFQYDAERLSGRQSGGICLRPRAQSRRAIRLPG